MLCVIIFFINTKAQTVIVDAENKPIPLVQVYTKNKNYFKVSDLNGKIDLSDFLAGKTNDTLFFHHLSYQTTAIKISGKWQRDTVRIQTKIFDLKELSVVESANENKNKYQVVKACYRSLQSNNGINKYYSDGNIEYLVGGKKNTSYSLAKKIENRYFQNDKLIEQDVQRKIEVVYTLSGPSALYLDKLPKKFIKDRKLIAKKNDEGTIELYNKDSLLYGKIESRTDYVVYTVNDYKKLKTRKLFKTEDQLLKLEYVMIFKRKPEIEVLELEAINDLVYYRGISEHNTKHDKDKEYTFIRYEDEIFVEEVLLNEGIIDEKKFYENGERFTKSNYTKPFWESCNCELYYPPSNSIFEGLIEK